MAEESHICSGLTGEEGALRRRLQAKLNRDLVANAPATRQMPRQDGVDCARLVATHLRPFINGNALSFELPSGLFQRERDGIFHSVNPDCMVHTLVRIVYDMVSICQLPMCCRKA